MKNQAKFETNRAMEAGKALIALHGKGDLVYPHSRWNALVVNANRQCVSQDFGLKVETNGFSVILTSIAAIRRDAPGFGEVVAGWLMRNELDADLTSEEETDLTDLIFWHVDTPEAKAECLRMEESYWRKHRERIAKAKGGGG